MDLHAAAALAERLLAFDPDRWLHVQGVAKVAESLAPVFSTHDHRVLVAAAHLHDVGYAAAARQTGLHSLDGARYLRFHGWPDRVARLVANHSAAQFEARRRGLLNVLLEEFPPECSAVADALTYCDMTTGPSGGRVTSAERLEEIAVRYGSGHLVAQAAASAREELLGAVRRTEALAAKARAAN